MVIDPESRTSYRELDMTTGDLAAAFVDAGVRKGTRVGLIMPNSVRWVQIAVALTRIGAVLVPLEHAVGCRRTRRATPGGLSPIPGERRGIPRPPLPGRSPVRKRTSNFLPYARFGQPTGSPTRTARRAGPRDRRRHGRHGHRRRPDGHHVHLGQQRSAQGASCTRTATRWALCGQDLQRGASPPTPGCICRCRSSGWAASAAEYSPRCWPAPPW